VEPAEPCWPVITASLRAIVHTRAAPRHRELAPCCCSPPATAFLALLHFSSSSSCRALLEPEPEQGALPLPWQSASMGHRRASSPAEVRVTATPFDPIKLSIVLLYVAARLGPLCGTLPPAIPHAASWSIRLRIRHCATGTATDRQPPRCALLGMPCRWMAEPRAQLGTGPLGHSAYEAARPFHYSAGAMGRGQPRRTVSSFFFPNLF
jgi:hypothetical protein